MTRYAAIALAVTAAGCLERASEATIDTDDVVRDEDLGELGYIDDLDPVGIRPREELTPILELAGAPPGAHPQHDASNGRWTFAVLSDLHLPNPRHEAVDRLVAGLIAMHVRFVVVTGDHTNGAALVDRRQARVDAWWASVTDALAPLRDAGIAVLPIAGNHDTYLRWQRDGYERAFADLPRWVAPLTINRSTGSGFAGAPYSYSVDVDGVHLSLTHVVDQAVERDVGDWLVSDLASPSARTARHRLVFGHVPLFSVIRRPPAHFVAKLGSILEHGEVDFYVAGHEHVTWDETFELTSGHPMRQVTVGCASGYYVFPPSRAARARAECRSSIGTTQRCTMPNGGDFELVRDRKGRFVERDLQSFALFSVDGEDIEVTPMSLDSAGDAHAFYLAP